MDASSTSVEAAPQRRPTLPRRAFLSTLGAAILGAGSWGYACRVEDDWLDIDRARVDLRRDPAERLLRIALLSDLHASNEVPLPQIAAAVDLVLAQDPDLVALGGDFITIGHQLPNTAAYAAVLAPLARRCPVLAVLGNHEGPRRTPIARYVESVIQRAGGQVLRNNTQRLFVGGRELLFSGLGDLWTNECRPEQCLFPLNEKDESRPAHIVLSHNPDSKDLAAFYDWDLMLCGHTHGGQVRIPFFGAPIVPVEDRRYIEGLNPFQDRHIYTTRGVGNLNGFRFNCRPWVSVVEI